MRRRRRKRDLLHTILIVLLFILGTINLRKSFKTRSRHQFPAEAWGIEEKLSKEESQRLQMLLLNASKNKNIYKSTSVSYSASYSSASKQIPRESTVSPSITARVTSTLQRQKPAFYTNDSLVTSQSRAELKRIFEFTTKEKHGVCSKVIYIGGRKLHESYKDKTYPICVDTRIFPSGKNKSNCLVYSYGIDNDWGFDDPMALLYECEVHAFDANMYDATDHQRNKKLWFHKMAIGNKNSDNVRLRGRRDYLFRKKFGEKELERLRQVKMKTLSSIMEELKHKKKIIDVFRIDAEGPRIEYEAEILKNILEEGVYRCIREIVFEMHFFGPYQDSSLYRVERLQEKYSVLRGMQNAGFQLIDVKIPSKFKVKTLNEFLHSLMTQSSVALIMLWTNTNATLCI